MDPRSIGERSACEESSGQVCIKDHSTATGQHSFASIASFLRRSLRCQSWRNLCTGQDLCRSSCRPSTRSNYATCHVSHLQRLSISRPLADTAQDLHEFPAATARAEGPHCGTAEQARWREHAPERGACPFEHDVHLWTVDDAAAGYAARQDQQV